MLNALGFAFSDAYRISRDRSDLDSAIRIFADAVEWCPEEDADVPLSLQELARLLFERDGDGDLRCLCSMLAVAVRLYPYNANILRWYAHSLHRRFQDHSHDPADLEKAAQFWERCVQLTPDSDPSKPWHLANYCTCLREMPDFEHAARARKCIALIHEAIQLVADDIADKVPLIHTLGTSLVDAFQRARSSHSDINEAVRLLATATRLTPREDPEYSKFSVDYGNALWVRHHWVRDVGDLDESIRVFEDVIKSMSSDHTQLRRAQVKLAHAKTLRYRYSYDVSDMNEAIELVEETQRVEPIEQCHKDVLLVLAEVLAWRYSQSGNDTDIERSVQLWEDAINIAADSDEHSELYKYLGGLGISLMIRFEALHQRNDIDRATSVLERALKLIPDNDFHEATFSIALAQGLFVCFQQFGDIQDVHKAMLHYSRAARSSSGSAVDRFISCCQWAMCERGFYGCPESLEPHSIAMELLPQMTWLGLSIADSQRLLTNIGQYVLEAAAAAIHDGRPGLALEWLEQGRSIIWGQMLQLRTPVDDLKEAYPDLAVELERLSKALEAMRICDDEERIKGPSSQLDRISTHEIAYQREQLVQRVRTLEGFETFMLPKTLLELLPAASGGPVVTVNVGFLRCDALILLPDLDEVMHVPLDNFSFLKAEELCRLLSTCIPNDVVSFHGIEYSNFQLLHSILKHILSELWLHVVKPVLDSLAISVAHESYELTRIWWCPTGPLTFLPIHAAGIYGSSKEDSKLHDFVISSYTPTLTALINGRHRSVPSQSMMLTVAQPFAHGQCPIPETHRELDVIGKRIGEFTSVRLEEDAATIEEVVKAMKESSWVHFACHGVQDVHNPTQGALLLAGSSRLTLSQIMSLSLPHAEFAFLSACQTATNTEALKEEAVHLAAGMHFAGYRGVVATMWSIMDSDAPQVADDVYAHLFRDKQPDAADAAYALHIATKNLREQGKPLLNWVPFVHMGI
ncbi:uncharacterized protein LAESUDRAFT_650328 [Laetiporus sulphureus 93-53]|uniref:CHAT domain-containing protein n=1 Tax=Laetiporus sulphureus 93-53 TaxID=1314785 RepID=A0A165EYH8_9APHY|nr:uncharacterized protein LAESUDRAFT_650328 [Laetiporus sulphureus 93-53]KZT07983.1 hypothetical protein LAESUDRAFT_650328 [Laetiporus sulphureus 93-53]